MLTSRLKPLTIPISSPNNHREIINWNENYGQTFKVVQRPESVETIEDFAIIITPKSKEEWNTWSEITGENLCRLKRNWEMVQKNLSEHKYNEILSFVNYK